MRDAGPLLQENGITLSYIESKKEGSVWMAGKYIDDETQPASFNENPLRAVCEVYLEILANQEKGG